MDAIVHMTARLLADTRMVYAWKGTFFGVSACIFLGCVVVLGRLDLLPERRLIAGVSNASSAVSSGLETSSTRSLAAIRMTPPVARVVTEEPVKVEIPSLKLSVTIANPTTTDVKALDALLLKGAVRYPTSAKLGENGNVVLFGHSSYLPIVGNQAYKAFNGIQKLKQGDTVTVYSSGTAYTYAVRTMRKESANDAVIQLSVTGRVLTLATCDSFGAKSDRFVVTADFVESHLIGA